MIDSAEEFITLTESENLNDQHRARHENAPEEVWFEVLEKYPEYVRSVIWNKTVPLSILHFLSTSPDTSVRYDLAMKRKLDEGLFEMLSKDPDDSVRHRIACNKKTPKHIIERLASDKVAYVAETAIKRLKDLEQAGW